MNRDQLRSSVASLPPNPTKRDLVQIGEMIASAAVRSAPEARGRSVALYVRHHLAKRLSENDQAAVRRIAMDAIERDTPPPVPREEPAHLYVTLKHAARLLGLDERVVRDLLRYPQYRRAWSWPRCWDGKSWFFRLDAIEHPERYAQLPPLEPPHNLPGWCLAVNDVENMDVFPTLRGSNERQAS
jgi:hypothetical protein